MTVNGTPIVVEARVKKHRILNVHLRASPSCEKMPSGGSRVKAHGELAGALSAYKVRGGSVARPEPGRSPRAAGDLSEMARKVNAAMVRCGNRVRVEILSHLACGPMSVGDLAEALDLDHTLVSKYLKVLTAGGVTAMQKVKTAHIFSIAESVQMTVSAELIELRVPLEGGLYSALTVSRKIAMELHPDAAFGQTPEAGTGATPGRGSYGPDLSGPPAQNAKSNSQSVLPARRSSQSTAT